MSYEADEHEDEFVQYLCKIDMLFKSYSSHYVYVLGDFNSNLKADDQGHVTSKFGKLLLDHCMMKTCHVTGALLMIATPLF